MELGDFTLADYIGYLNGTQSFPMIPYILDSSPVVVHKDVSFPQRMQNMWTIGTHIAQGLEFMHSHRHVHRDLKPSNGAAIQRLSTY